MLTGSIAALGQPVRDWPEGGELQHGRRAGGGAGAGGRQGSGAQGSGRRGGQLAQQAGRVAQLGAEICHAVGGSDHAIAGGAESLQPGTEDAFAKGDTAALPFYKRAVELDPNFAMAYAAHVRAAYSNLNEVGRAAENARKAYELREKVSERERFSIEANYYLFATGELEKAAQVYELWQQTYPRDALPYVDLGFIYCYPWKLGEGIGGSAARQCAWSRTTASTTSISAPATRASTGWMRRRRCTSRRRSASWRVRTCSRTATSWLF